MTKSIWILCLLAACGKSKALPNGLPPDAALAGKYERLLAVAPDIEAHYGEDHDGALFAPLTAAGYKRPIDIERWRDATGQWWRTPAHDTPDLSRDFVLGVTLYALAFHRPDLVDGLYDFARSHKLIMDSRSPEISLLLPSWLETVALVEHRLGGMEHSEWDDKVSCLSTLQGFEAHLQSLIIGIRALAADGDTAGEACIRKMAARQPNNAWFAAVEGLYLGTQERTVELLLKDSVCPEDRLPTSDDRCEEWVWQRNESPGDWGPCPDRHQTYSGGDCALAMAVALGQIK
jgi:hypothetical protein